MQTSWILGFLLVGFLIYITDKGQLSAYQTAIFGGSVTPPAPSS